MDVNSCNEAEVAGSRPEKLHQNCEEAVREQIGRVYRDLSSGEEEEELSFIMFLMYGDLRFLKMDRRDSTTLSLVLFVFTVQSKHVFLWSQ